MTYSKEQTQTIVLLVIVGLIVALGSYMGLIKPNLGRTGKYDASYAEYEAELGEQRQVLKANLDTVQHARALEERATELEGRLRHGLFAGRLTSHFEALRRTHGFEFRYTNDRERIEPVSGGRYYELSNQFTIIACGFDALGRFIQVLETDAPSVRISDLEVTLHDPEEPDGLVDAHVELRVFGYKDGEDAAWDSASNATAPLEGRNPFRPPGTIDRDPHRGLRARLAQVQFQGTMGQSALVAPLPGASAKLVRKGQVIRLGEAADQQVRLVEFSRNALVVYHEATQQYYRLTLYTAGDQAGHVRHVEEIIEQ